MHRWVPAVLPAVVLWIATTSFAQQTAGPNGLRIEDVERIALEKHPVIVQANASVAAARGRARQAGLYPNPMVGITGNEVRNSPVIRGGEIGFFVQQEVVLGGKLRKSRSTLEQEIARTEANSEARRLRVLNDVRTAFYRVLAAQRIVEVRTRLGELAKEAVDVSDQLRNIGLADLPDVLAIEVEEQRSELALIQARNQLDQMWRQLAAAVGYPAMSRLPVAGDLEQLPELELDSSMNMLLRDSPEIKEAQSGIRRAESALDRAQSEKIPNLELLGGLRYNRERLELGQRPVGLEGFFDVGIRIPLFDRNQGGVQAAKAEFTSAQREVERVQLSLQSRLAAAFREYLDAREAATRYKTAMLPRAQRAYDLYLNSFRQMAASYPLALIAQRTLFQLQEEYNDTLATVWIKAIEIRGLLLTGAMDDK